MAGAAVRVNDPKRRGGPGLFSHTSSARSRAWNPGGDVRSAHAGASSREGKENVRSGWRYRSRSSPVTSVKAASEGRVPRGYRFKPLSSRFKSQGTIPAFAAFT